MNLIKNYLFKNFETIFTLFSATVLSILLLAIRLKVTHSFFLLFLVWNLFLAAVPYIISSYVVHTTSLAKFAKAGLLILWMLFLPNAPYIVTDFIHLSHAEASFKIYDTLLIGVFAISGLLFYVVSVRQVVTTFSQFLKRWQLFAINWLIPFLCAFGIYLGRVLRWNSWDILSNPVGLLQDILEPITKPFLHSQVWVFIILFWLSLKAIQSLFNYILKSKAKTDNNNNNNNR